MLLSVVILLNVLVYGGCHLLREKKSVIEKRMEKAPQETISPDCTPFDNGQFAWDVAKNIHLDAIAALKKAQIKEVKILAERQFGFLYLHGTSQDGRLIENKGVRNILSLTKGYYIAKGLVEDGYWPWYARGQNLLLGAPQSFSYGLSGESFGHAEDNILAQLPRMQSGYLERHNDECPCFVILGTVRPPCNEKTKDKKLRKGCAIKYVHAKNEFATECPQTVFYLFVDRAPDSKHPNYVQGWENTKELYDENNIRILKNFEE